MTRLLILFLAFLMATVVYFPQTCAGESPDSHSNGGSPLPDSPTTPSNRFVSPDYLLGAGDQIALIVPGLEEEYNGKVFRIDAGGDVTLPLVGRIRAAGMSTAALEADLHLRLRGVLKDPQVVVNISTFGSEPVSVLGSVRTPGIIQLQGRKTLFEVLSLAGGLQPDAGYSVQVTRPLASGSIPVPNVRVDQTAQVSVAVIRLRDLINVPNASENIEILPGDSLSVPRAGIVYVVGSVAKPGGYPLDENESLSALQVLSLAEGLQVTAAGSKARILRTVPGNATRMETPVDLHRLMAGKDTDMPLHAGDILFVPGSNAKRAGLRTIDAIVNAATYATVYLH